MLNLFIRVFSFLDENFLVRAIKKTFNKLPLVKPTKKLLNRFDIVKKAAIFSRLGVSNYAKFELEKRFLQTLQMRQEKAVIRAIIKQNNLKAALGKFKSNLNKIKSPWAKMFTTEYFGVAIKSVKFELEAEMKKTNNLKKLYDSFKGGYRNWKLAKGRDNQLFENRQPVGLFNNSSWLVGYKRNTPNGTLFTKNSSFTVQGLNDNMIDRMLVAPGAGKYLWNTLWLHKRKGTPDKKIRSIFSGSFRAEYAKRKQAFK